MSYCIVLIKNFDRWTNFHFGTKLEIAGTCPTHSSHEGRGNGKSMVLRGNSRAFAPLIQTSSLNSRTSWTSCWDQVWASGRVHYLGDFYDTQLKKRTTLLTTCNYFANVNLQEGVKALLDLEEKFLGNLQQTPSRVHNALRNVGKFPLIITTNMDELLECFLWKTGNGGEKLRLDQVRWHIRIRSSGDSTLN